jgi:hypothetical protein
MGGRAPGGVALEWCSSVCYLSVLFTTGPVFSPPPRATMPRHSPRRRSGGATGVVGASERPQVGGGRAPSGRGNAAMQAQLAGRLGPSATASDATKPRQDLVSGALATTRAALPYRAAMEASFGEQLGDVEVHAGGPVVANTLDALGAEAAAIGEALLFRSAQPDKELVAHELTHVVQARNAGGGASAGSTSKPGDGAEREAEDAGAAVARGESVNVCGAPTGEIQGGWFSGIADTASNMWDSASSAVSSVVGTATSAATSVASTVTSVASTATDWISDTATTIADVASSTVNTVSQVITDTASTVSQTVSDAWSATTQVATSAADQVQDWGTTAASTAQQVVADNTGWGATAPAPEELDAAGIEDLLLHDNFDWNVTEDEAVLAADAMLAMSDSELSALIDSMDDDAWKALEKNYPGSLPADLVLRVPELDPELQSGFTEWFMHFSIGDWNAVSYEDWSDKGTLFVDEPTYQDVLQGSTSNDCYFLSTLASVASTEPSTIKEMVQDNGDGTYDVRLYTVSGDSGTVEAIWITVDGDLPTVGLGNDLAYAHTTDVDADGNAELWVPIVEKAFAELAATDGYVGNWWYDNVNAREDEPRDDIGYDSIEWDNTGFAYITILGDDSAGNLMELSADQADAQWQEVTVALDDGEAVTTATSTHSKSIQSYREDSDGSRYVTIYDQARGTSSELTWEAFLVDHENIWHAPPTALEPEAASEQPNS